MKIPGLDDIVTQMKELPEATAEMQGSLERIEELLERLLDVQMATMTQQYPSMANRLQKEWDSLR